MLITEQHDRSIQIPTDRHPFPLQLEHTALIVVDMQNAFCHPEGFCSRELGADLTAARAISKGFGHKRGKKAVFAGDFLDHQSKKHQSIGHF